MSTKRRPERLAFRVTPAGLEIADTFSAARFKAKGLHAGDESRSPRGFPDWIRVYPDGTIVYQAKTVKRGDGVMRIKACIPVKKYDPGKYHIVACRIDGRMRLLRVHRLVLLAFDWRDGCEKLDVNHKNGIRTDNRLENLEWCTRSENHLHAYRVLGRKPAMLGRISHNRGKSVPSQWKPVIARNENGDKVHEFPSLSHAEKAGFGRSGISHCISGRQKSHKGLVWEYSNG